ncbi:glutathione S-transferase family protein [Algiphilus sp.]|uniref:glutathione S-transferase family protein n=1 Tax=Algiphilus sp. TaxID=1872431 RepID=UPI001CA67A37|nr:glutathione S-transferase family protein [Algiphilus sp.]MBY8965362.1 glutathione S-transferase family protein [Algiphilus acroporae]MCI5063355.1 glutathione S-transferase family protein [Algiphilus sp.]MCI5102654.1 glutathione S-transferase family protein [Algiphilus sp.]MCR9089976.1 glutathione S-transferase family protein [Pseudomonadota bacterium]
MKLFTTPKAISPARVHFFLAEKGIEVERELINLMEGEHRSAAYRSKVPNGRVPALQLDDGTVLCETVAISRYVEEAIQPDPPLLGTNPLERARIEMYDRMMELELMLPMAMTFRHTHPAMKALEDQVAEYGEKQRGVAERRLKRLDKELAGRDFIAGDDFSIADITAWCSIRFFRAAGFTPADEQHHLRDWFERIGNRPAAGAAFAG